MKQTNAKNLSERDGTNSSHFRMRPVARAVCHKSGGRKGERPCSSSKLRKYFLTSSWCGGGEESGAAILVAVAGAITGLWCPVVDIGVDGYSNVSCVLC